MNNGKKKIWNMPQISRFFGIIISMYYDDHEPPHFHAMYGEFSIKINITDFSVISGYFPSRALGLVMEWASLHQNELLDNWLKAKKYLKLNQVEPLK